MTRLKFSSKRTIWNIWYLEQQQIIGNLARDIWKIATPPTAMDDDGLPARPATAISRLVLILFFTLFKKQRKCTVSEENKNFPADCREYNAVVDFLLFA